MMWKRICHTGTCTWIRSHQGQSECRWAHKWHPWHSRPWQTLCGSTSDWQRSTEPKCTFVILYQCLHCQSNYSVQGEKENEGRKRGTVSMNLHGVCRSAKPTSRWAPKAHRMMGKTHWRHFGKNVLVFDKNRDPFLCPSQPLKRTSTKMAL